MHKFVSITLFSFLILFLILIGFFSLKKSESEALQLIDLQGSKLLSQSEYLQFLNIQNDVDVQKYSVSSIREKLLCHPYVKNVNVVVDADKKVFVQIQEKKFEAATILQGQIYLVSTKKKIIPVLPNTEMLDLPVLTNLSGAESKYESEKDGDLQSAFTIIRSAKKLSDKLSQSISEINFQKGGDIVLTLTNAKSIVLLGKQNLVEKIYTLDAVIKQIGDKIFLTNTNYIDLRYANNIFIGANESVGI